MKAVTVNILTVSAVVEYLAMLLMEPNSLWVCVRFGKNLHIGVTILESHCGRSLKVTAGYSSNVTRDLREKHQQ